MTIAALYVQPGGAYYGLPGVEPWGLPERDAREYAGPHPVIAHPPCARWCRLAKFVQSQHPQRRVGEDDGCFASAMDAVRRWGGVVEHPAWSLAWTRHGLAAPATAGWQRLITGEWVTAVSQRNYGHPCTKWTWIVYVGDNPALLDWRTPDPPTQTISSCSRRADGTVWRGKAVNGLTEASKRTAAATPPAFRDALLALVRR